MPEPLFGYLWKWIRFLHPAALLPCGETSLSLPFAFFSEIGEAALYIKQATRAKTGTPRSVSAMASSDDEELKAAIALSLADQARQPSPELGSSAAVANVSPPSRKRPVVIDLSNDTDESDDELMPVLRVGQVVGSESQSGSEPSATASKAEEADLDPGPRGDQEDRKDGTTLLQHLDRKTMEQERLARLKRKASVSPPRLRREKQPSSRLPGKRRPALANRTTPTPELDPQGLKSSSGVSPPVQQASALSGLCFPRGVVRKTWAFGYERKDDIKFEEVLQKNDLTVAVLSAFQWDVEWLMRKIDLSKTKMVFVMQAKDDATVRGSTVEVHQELRC